MTTTLRPLQFFQHSKAGLTVNEWKETGEPGESFGTFPDCSLAAYSPGDGTYLGIIRRERGLFIYDAGTAVDEVAATAADSPLRLKLVSSFLRPNITKFAFSPKSTYLITWERPSRQTTTDTDAPPDKNMFVWRIHDGQKISEFFLRSQPLPQKWPPVKFNQDETIMSIVSPGGINFYEHQNGEFNMNQASHKLYAKNIEKYEWSPKIIKKETDQPDQELERIVVFSSEGKNSPGNVAVYDYPHLGREDVVCYKVLPLATHSRLIWNGAGNALLVLASTDHDPTGKSYYGATTLHILFPDIKDGNMRVDLRKDGPVYDFAWHPNSREFLVCYGNMPSLMTLFEHKKGKVAAKYDFGTNMRNCINFSQEGRLLIIAGFGNLTGGMDFWDYRNKSLLKTTQCHCANMVSWSPNSKFFSCACIFSRMRVDNYLRIFSSSGKVVYSQENIDELYSVGWRPAPNFHYPAPEVLPPENVTHSTPSNESPKPSTGYRHPNASRMRKTMPSLTRPVNNEDKPKKVENYREQLRTPQKPQNPPSIPTIPQSNDPPGYSNTSPSSSMTKKKQSNRNAKRREKRKQQQNA